MHAAVDLRSLIQGQVRQLFGVERAQAEAAAAARAAEPYDLGLFGPEAACWKVHGDFTSMMIGGVAALMLQMLHPAALAGVWDHSRFGRDSSGRLRRTAQFIAATTFGSTAEAMAQIERVKAIHGEVRGVLPDGAPYFADDPELLAWVHVAGAEMFLAAYVRHRDPDFPAADQDRYFAETAKVARLLGAAEVPEARSEARAYLDAMRPQLRCDYRTREVIRSLLWPGGRSVAMAPFTLVVAESAKDLLPDWARAMHGFGPGERPAVRAGAGAVGALMRWALRDGTEAEARRRAAERAAD
jgi:uncharacterized protein (DUF2236 family)